MSDFAQHLQAALEPNYHLDHELAGGGMSRVFVATDRVLGRKVVVKVLPPELAAGVNRERFRREIQVLAQLQHPHIVPLLSAGEQGDLLWYTMPFIEGESLRAALERHRKFTVREVIRILHDIVDALSFAHARGVVHRDIKPANVLTQGAHALVTDFGVAKALSAAMPMSGMTSGGIAIGTPAYMAPEQLAGDATADHRMDIYAVGLLAYELLSGSSPFSGPSPRETLAAQLTRDPQPLHELSADVPRSLSELIMRCLAKDPNARPQTADEVLQELDAMTMPLGMTPQRGGVEKPLKRRPWAGIAALVIALVVIAAAGFGVARSRASRDGRKTSATSARPPLPTAPVAPAASTDSLRRGSSASGLTPPTPVRALITHDDSVHIAAAVARKLEQMKAADSVAKARLAEETQRKMIDSIITANSGTGSTGAPSSGPRRVIIAEPPPLAAWPEAALLGRAVSDSLARMIRTRPKQFSVVDQDSVRALLARTREIGPIARATGADLFVSIRLTALPNDSAMMMLQVYDLTATAAYRQRNAATRLVRKNEVLGTLDALLLSTMAYLDEMTRAPRRPAPVMPPAPPTNR